jgi:hypothetical protein
MIFKDFDLSALSSKKDFKDFDFKDFDFWPAHNIYIIHIVMKYLTT